jgi:hypothetical protein
MLCNLEEARCSTFMSVVVCYLTVLGMCLFAAGAACHVPAVMKSLQQTPPLQQQPRMRCTNGTAHLPGTHHQQQQQWRRVSWLP